MRWQLSAVVLFLASGCTNKSPSRSSLIIQEQGSFAVGGAVATHPGKFDPIKQGAFSPKKSSPAGQTRHGDHAYVFYQIPEKARKLPLVFWHGYGVSSKTWETTPDGREGFQNIFLRRRYSVYLMDQPGRGKAAKALQPATIAAVPDEQLWFGIFRLGVWPHLYAGSQFSKDPEALNQLFRQMVPDAGPSFSASVYVDAASALFDKLGPAILVTHSASGTFGWWTVLKNKNIRAVAAYEPSGEFIFPDGEQPETLRIGPREIRFATVPKAAFAAFTKIPIMIYYGDNIPAAKSELPGEELARNFLAVARKWAETVNRHGGDAKVVHLPEIGIKGNTHFPFSDRNNVEVADQLSKFLQEKSLDI